MEVWTDKRQIAGFALEIRDRYKSGWDLLGKPVQVALVDSYILRLSLGLADSTFSKSTIKELREKLLASMGLSD